jgi:hypothetical protein
MGSAGVRAKASPTAWTTPTTCENCPPETEKTKKETKERPTKGGDGGTSEHIIERDESGDAISKTHRVTTGGKVVHQHQDHIGKEGSQLRFPNEWVEYPSINAD